MANFGGRLKKLRTQAGLTQQQLADRLGVTKSVVSYYELQERYPSPEILIKLSGIFHTSTDFLLGMDDRVMIDVSGLSDMELNAINTIIQSLKKCKK